MTGVTSVQPCGCVITRHGGHTHTAYCRECLAREFAPRKPEIYPAVQESVGVDTAWLDK